MWRAYRVTRIHRLSLMRASGTSHAPSLTTHFVPAALHALAGRTMIPNHSPDPARDDRIVRVLLVGAPAHARRGLFNTLESVNAMHLRCTETSRYSRYHSARWSLSPREWERLTDPAQGATWIAVLDDAPDHVIALSHLLATDREGVSELALLVQDDWQNRGLGTLLTHHAVGHARRHGSHTITLSTHASNKAMLAIARNLGAVTPRAVSGTVDLTIDVSNQCAGDADGVNVLGAGASTDSGDWLVRTG
ncbi:GNAT family N-acetyltransferase [Streptomyces sp. NPDC088560]|uniref:GNAT family N-acetyltransferase n=1 Tax=Streptomyces sp. NPDC088560 TaxID=3365868 RepID=UPI0038158DE7